MEIACFLFGIDRSMIPSHQTVLDWVAKCGLSTTHRRYTMDELKDVEYSIIMDNSISVGGQDLHLELMAPVDPSGHPLRHSDVKVLNMSVKERWTADDVQKELSSTVDGMGKNPLYVLTDNGKVMQKAVYELGLPGHRDISHSFGMFLKQTYFHESEFRDFIHVMGNARRYAHTQIGYLMPPKRRAIARYMNLFTRIDWAYSMLQNDYRLTSVEKYYYGFVQRFASLVEELHDVMELYRHMEKLCKEKGLSHETAAECRRCITRTLLQGSERTRRLGGLLIEYIRQEESLLETPTSTHNISSDVIESVFGYYKDRMCSNKDNGFTSFVLLIPLHLMLSDFDACETFCACETIGETTMNDVKKWRRDNLRPNIVSKRIETLKSA